METIIIERNSRPSLSKALIAILFGALFVFASQFVLNYLVTLIGVILILVGSSSLIAKMMNNIKNSAQIERKQFNSLSIESYASIIFGVVLVIMPSFFVFVMMFLLGLLLAFAAFDQFYALNQVRRISGAQIPTWLFIVPSLILLVALLIMINPFEFAQSILIVCFGFTLLFYGITNLLRYILKK